MIDDNRPSLTGALNLVRFSVPYAVIAVLFMMNVITVPYVQDNTLKIPLILMCVYYWSIYRPMLLPSWLVFVMGVILDILTMMPIGLTAFILVVTQKSIIYQRRYLMGQPFIILWAGFVFITVASLGLTWVIFNMMGGMILGLKSIGFAFLLTILSFPFVTILLHATHKVLPSPEQRKSINLQRA